MNNRFKWDQLLGISKDDWEVEWKPFLKFWLGLSLILHLIAAIFSKGFYHFDEHFQILEFLNYKLGRSSAVDLPWEFGHQMRSWSQPFVYYLVVKPMQWFGIQDPFQWALGCRLISSILGWVASVFLALSCFKWFDDKLMRKLAIYGLVLTWFIPYIHARTSGENLTSSCFFIGMSLLVLKGSRLSALTSLLIGLLMGLSFLFRFQTGFMVMFCFFWAWFIQGISYRKLSLWAIGIVLCFGLGVLVDYWGYGNWTVSAWNYLDQNILKNRIADQGATPWWEYLRTTFLRGIPPISLPLILGTFWAWIKYPKHVLTWSFLPFTLVHFAISGKALRFLFPLALVAPIFVVMSLQSLQYSSERLHTWWQKRKFRWPVFFVASLNILLLVIASIRSSNVGINFYEHVYSKSEKISKLFVNDENPFTMLGLPLNFYRKDAVEVEIVDSFSEYLESFRKSKETWYFANRGHKFFEVMSKRAECHLDFLSYPQWVLNYNIGNWVGRSRVWSLFRCR